jgi:smad nuclear-interacting protein 1
MFPFYLVMHELTGKSVFLFGKKREISDFYLEHPTVSGQHAVIQFRKNYIRTQDGLYRTEVKPYIMDLER